MSEKSSPLLRSLSANRRPSQFLDVTPVNDNDIAEILHGDANVAEVFSFLRDCGLSDAHGDDPRLASIFADLKSCVSLSCYELTDLKRKHLLLQKALSGELAISDFKSFSGIVSRIHEECRHIDDGEVASYIPQLAEVDPSLFGVAVCTVDGQRFSIGDAKTVFSVQSVSKVISYAIALESEGQANVHSHVGMEPSGRNFNERVLLPSGIPHNPLINTGAIMVASLLFQSDPRWKRFEKAIAFWRRLTGNTEPSLLQSTYLAERETANRNFGLAHMMAESGNGSLFPQDLKSIQTVLDEYFSYCSLGVTAEMMAQAAATLANGGLNPITDDRVFSPETVTAVLSTMMTCGMYDASGEFSATNGFPAKSGVSGIIMSVIPGVGGICAFSPRIDSFGNSVRGLRFFSDLAKQAVSTPLYNTPTAVGTSFGNQFEWRTSGEDSVLSKFTVREFSSLWWSAATGDNLRIRQVAARGIDVNEANYSNRTALNFAIRGGHFETVNLLISLGASLSDDELFGTYLEDASSAGRTDIYKLLILKKTELPSDDWIDEVEGVLTLSRLPLYRFFAGIPNPSLEKALNECGLQYTPDNSRLTSVQVRGLCGKLIIPDWRRFKHHVVGSVGDSGLHLAVCTVDSQCWQSEETPVSVALDGLARVLLYELALEELGSEKVHMHVGREPSGQSEGTLQLNSDGMPYNALTMSGSLTVCDVLVGTRGKAEVVNKLKSRLGLPSNHPVVPKTSIVDHAQYMDLVRCTMYWLSSKQLISSPVSEVIDLFMECHSIAVDLPIIARYAKSLASKYSPLSALLYTCGLDEKSGEFAFKFGLPARTSLMGTVMGVIPGVMGYAVFDPQTTAPTVLPQTIADFQSKFGEETNFHMFRRHFATGRSDPTLYFWSNERLAVTKFLSAAFHGDLSSMKHMVAEGLDVNCRDMDGRTALHIALGVGNFAVAQYLLSIGADQYIKDVWGFVPS